MCGCDLTGPRHLVRKTHVEERLHGGRVGTKALYSYENLYNFEGDSRMARAQGKNKAVAVPQRRKRPSASPRRRLATSEARSDLSSLVNELGAHDEPAESLADNAIEIGPHRKGGAWLVPEVDARATQDALDAAEDELENISLSFLIQDRLAQSSETVPARDVIRDLGFDDLLEGLPE